MKKFTMLVGPPGSGKSSLACRFEGGTQVVSADNLRKELSDKTKSVSKIAYTELKFLFGRRTEHVVYDCCSMNRKGRKKFYDLAKEYGYYTDILVLVEEPNECMRRVEERNKSGFGDTGYHVDPSVVIKMLKHFEQPKIGVDCDECGTYYDPEAPTMYTRVTEQFMDQDIYHGNIHHMETVQEHITQASLVARDLMNGRKPWIHVALYHDLGKFYTKQGNKFFGHANVSAYLAMRDLNGWQVDVIAHHMHTPPSSDKLEKLRTSNVKEDNKKFEMWEDVGLMQIIDNRSRIKFSENPFTQKKFEWNGTKITKNTNMIPGPTYQLVRNKDNHPVKAIREILKYRSATWDKQGNLIQLGLPKFFNIGELENEFDTPVGECKYYEKFDGSLIMVSNVNGEALVSTRGSIDSDQAIMAREYMGDFLPRQGVTICFELVGKDNQHIIDYNFDLGMQWLCTIEHDTGEIKMNPHNEITDPREFMKRSNVEGLVVQDSEGNLFKMKTDDFIMQHRIAQMKFHELADAIHNGDIDDLLPRMCSTTKEFILNYIEWEQDRVHAWGEIKDIPSRDIFMNDEYIEYREDYSTLKSRYFDRENDQYHRKMLKRFKETLDNE